MEGPSLVIAVEEFKPFIKKKIVSAQGGADLPYDQLVDTSLQKAKSWGKHLLLTFTHVRLRIHFLMFGSYRIDDPRPNRDPKLFLDFGSHQIYFYSCAIRQLPKGFEKEYDWSVDLMSPKWSAKKAITALRAHPSSKICDILMDQSIFSGLGNIMKNEILFNLRMHPETCVENLTPSRIGVLVKEAEDYAWRFYDWKKKNVLKRNWKIMRKKKCPTCEGTVTKRLTGKLKRWSHYCTRCQKKG